MLPLLVLLAACGAKRTPPPPPSHPETAVDVIVTAAVGGGVEGASVVCNSLSWGLTNADGYLVNNHVRVGQQDCEVTKEGFFPVTVGHSAQPDTEGIRVTLHQLQPEPTEPGPGEHPVSEHARQGRLTEAGGPFFDASGPVNPAWFHAGNLFAL